jgi:hypothetical protein
LILPLLEITREPSFSFETSYSLLSAYCLEERTQLLISPLPSSTFSKGLKRTLRIKT